MPNRREQSEPMNKLDYKSPHTQDSEPLAVWTVEAVIFISLIVGIFLSLAAVVVYTAFFE